MNNAGTRVKLPTIGNNPIPVNIGGTYVFPTNWTNAQRIPLMHFGYGSAVPVTTPTLGVIPVKPLPGTGGGGGGGATAGSSGYPIG